MTQSNGIQLDCSDGRSRLTALPDINAALAEAGSRVWPLDLSCGPDEIRRLLRQPVLTEADIARLRDHVLLPRQRLLDIIAVAGREPNVPDGGALSTTVANHGYAYPQLWVVQGDVDYTRFDRFHVNVSDDGTGVDEVLQVLSGSGIVIHLRLADGRVLTLRLDCPAEGSAWLVTYDGGKPHIGSLSGAVPGTKVVVQAIGPAQWGIQYECEGYVKL